MGDEFIRFTTELLYEEKTVGINYHGEELLKCKWLKIFHRMVYFAFLGFEMLKFTHKPCFSQMSWGSV